MNLKPARLLIALIAVVAAPAFAQNVAVVNGKAIPSARLDAMVKQVVAQGRDQDSPKLRDAIKKQLIGQEVLVQEATKQGYDKNAEVKAALEDARQQILVNALVMDYVKKHQVSDAEIKAEYDAFVAQNGGKQYHLRHIVTETAAEADGVIAKLKGGAKFEDLAKTSKDTGTASNGGDLDWVNPKSVPKPFADAFVGLNKGQVTEKAVQTPNGFHVIKVDEVRDATLPSLEELKAQVANEVARKKVMAYQDELVKKAKVQ